MSMPWTPRFKWSMVSSTRKEVDTHMHKHSMTKAYESESVS
jgi:hypothetical protein